MQCRCTIENMVVLLCGTQWSKRIHSDPCHELLHVLNGQMSIDCEDGSSYPLRTGDSLLIPAGVKHRDSFNPRRDLKLQLIHFEMEHAKDYFATVKPEIITNLVGNVRNEINSILFWLRNDLNLARQDITVNECRLNTILQLVFRTASEKCQNALPVRSKERLGSVVRHYLDCNFCDRNLTLSTTAKHFHVSNSHLSKIFHEEVGTSFINYLTDLRMREAEYMLRDTYQSVAEIAFAVGYDSPNYFARIFQHRTGLPPSSYRETAFVDTRRKKE